MAFQVKEFHSIQKGTTVDWKFKLINKNTTQLNFYDLDETSRSLLDLVKDISGQIDIEMQSKRKKSQQKNRMIRKACQKLIKVLNLSLTSFSADIGQELDTVKAFFKKQKIPENECSTLVEKCKKWTLATWVIIIKRAITIFLRKFIIKQQRVMIFVYNNSKLRKQKDNFRLFYFILLLIQLSLESNNFFKSTQKYIDSYIKDGKKINPDFDASTQLYGVIIGQNNTLQNEVNQYQGSSLIQIDVNLLIDNKYVSQCLLYNTENLSYIKTRNFSQNFVSDLLRQNNIEGMNKQSIQELQQQVRIQIRSQCLYKTLLKKHAPVLLNFSTIQIPPQVKQYLIPIEIKLKNQQGDLVYEDYFQWDILNENNSIQQFCQQLIEDTGLDSKYFSQLCYLIRTQINTELQWKFMLLVKTFKQIHKDRQSPKLNTQTTMMIKKNLPYTMDVLMLPQNKTYKPSQNIVFANSDVYSLLSRNYDILPEQFQTFLMDRQGKQKNQDYLQKTQVPSSGKSSRKLNSFPDLCQKKGLKVQNNPYLNGINSTQCNHVWKKLVDEKTTIE